MKAVLRHLMSSKHNCGVESLMRSDFLKSVRDDRWLGDVQETIKKH